MDKLKRKLQNGLMVVSVYMGMSLFGGVSILSGAYLHNTQPEEPQIVLEYESLNEELYNLSSIKRFSLEEALDSNKINSNVEKADSLSARIESIKSSEDYSTISNYEEERSRHKKYWIIPFASIMLGASSMLYGVHLESKINSRPFND